MAVGRSITAEQTVAALQALVAERGCPENVRCDNGPELTAHALRDWCRLASVTTSYIEPGAPWQNPFAESFNARVRDELLNLEEYSCLAEAGGPRPRTGASTTTASIPIPPWATAPRTRSRPRGAPRRADPAAGDARGRKHVARLALGLAFATSFRPARLLAC